MFHTQIPDDLESKFDVGGMAEQYMDFDGGWQTGNFITENIGGGYTDAPSKFHYTNSQWVAKKKKQTAAGKINRKAQTIVLTEITCGKGSYLEKV